MLNVPFDVVLMIEKGIIHLGMTKADLRNLLGQPHDWGGLTRKYKEPCIWKYWDVEFWWFVKKHRTPYPGPELVGVYYENPRDGIMLLKEGVTNGY